MDARQRTRTCVRTRAGQETGLPRGARQICLPMDRETYDRLWNDAAAVRQYLDELLKSCPELFPTGIEHGFQLTGHLPESKKLLGIRLRQLRLADGRVFTLRPIAQLAPTARLPDPPAAVTARITRPYLTRRSALPQRPPHTGSLLFHAGGSIAS